MSNQREADRAVVDRAMTDPEFRARLVEDPKAAVAEVLGVELPEDVTITVVEQRPNEAVIVIPPERVGGDPVTDAELSSVSGGWRLQTAKNHCATGDWP